MSIKINENEKVTWLNIRLAAIFLMSIFMTACASDPLKAPCNEHATFCGTKTKINHW